MEFEENVIEILGSIFTTHDFFIAEKYKNYIRFESGGIAVRIGHNELDRSNILSVNINGGSSILVNESMLHNIFECTLRVDEVVPDVFLNNFKLFFEDKGRLILEKDSDVLQIMQEYSEKRDIEYTMKLLASQNLEAANMAWAKHDLNGFIKLVDTIGLQNLPHSFELKYKIAKKGD